ncbi:MAG TPA: hypothetical protein VF995_10610, partial [Actinomycetota bacterium]
MNRKKLLAVLGALAVAATAGAIAIGANLGLFSLAGRTDPVGRLSPTSQVALDAGTATSGAGGATQLKT